MEFTLEGADPRFAFLKRRLEADGHRLIPDGGRVIAPPSARRGIPYYDDPVYVLKNAALTAEGAVELLMRRTDRSLAELSVLVTGYGRIGRFLAPMLAAMGAEATVAARDPAARALAALSKHNTVDINNISSTYDVVVNTVPAPVLRGDHGAGLCLDLASAPGGWADDTSVLRAPGLPGVYAPRTAADILADAVYRILEVDIN